MREAGFEPARPQWTLEPESTYHFEKFCKCWKIRKIRRVWRPKTGTFFHNLQILYPYSTWIQHGFSVIIGTIFLSISTCFPPNSRCLLSGNIIYPQLKLHHKNVETQMIKCRFFLIYRYFQNNILSGLYDKFCIFQRGLSDFFRNHFLNTIWAIFNIAIYQILLPQRLPFWQKWKYFSAFIFNTISEPIGKIIPAGHYLPFRWSWNCNSILDDSLILNDFFIRFCIIVQLRFYNNSK